MEKTKRRQALTKSKGERLNWTPLHKAEKVSLKDLDIKGRKVSSEYIQKAKKFVDRDKDLLIP